MSDHFSRRTRILSALKRAGSSGCHNTQLTMICLRYGARIWELRRIGFKITTERESQGLYRYTLRK